MRKTLTIIAISLSLVSCKKDKDNILWSRSFGQGAAYYVTATADSGLLACGKINDKPYLVKLAADKSAELTYSSDLSGLFTSAWCDTSRIVAAGSSGRRLTLTILNKTGESLWDTTLVSGVPVERAGMAYTGNGNFLVVASADPDSSKNSSSGLFFVRFDTTGSILMKKEVTDPNFLSAGDFVTDRSGNIFLTLTRKNTGAKSKASVAKFNSNIQKIWETELYNNTEVASVSRGIKLGNLDSVLVTGKTQVTKSDGTLDNSFLATLGKSGTVGKKRYLENANSGCGLVIDNNNKIFLLNRNCFFVNIIDPSAGYSYERLLMFRACDTYNTDAFGVSCDLNYDGNIAVAGSVGNNFYLALKPAR